MLRNRTIVRSWARSWKKSSKLASQLASALKPAPFDLEILEDRRLLSASAHFAHSALAHGHHAFAADTATTTPTANTTTYSALQTSDAAAATELQTLATPDGVATIAADQTVYIHTVNSTTTDYSVVLTPSTGVTVRLTTDQAGTPVTAPTSSTTTFGGGTVPAAAVSEINTLAGDLSATLPASTDSVYVRTADGLTTYSISLTPSSGTGHNIHITVDAAGNPAGNMKLPFSDLPTLVSGGLTTLATGKSATIPSTQNVFVRTAGGVTTYTVYLASSGQSLSLTVDTGGNPATPASGGFGHGFGGHGFGSCGG